MNIIGHAHILDFFSRVIKNKRLSHAYCFAGPEHLGKRTVAEQIIRELFAMGEQPLATNPDIAIVEQEINEKTDKTKKNIDIEQVQYLREFLARRPFFGGMKAAIIDEAEKMNDSSANALLKTLEEPTRNTIIFLVTSDTSGLPATILSRCQTINFHPVPTRHIIAGLIGRGIEDGLAERLAGESQGAPGLAIQWTNDGEAYDTRCTEATRFQGMLGKSFADKIQAVEPFFADKEDHIAARERLQEILWLWQCEARASALHGGKGVWSIEQYAETSGKIAQARTLLSQNIHPRLLIEQVLLALP